MLIGYARVSTDEQSLSPQKDALASAGCDKIFTDVVSGAKPERVGLNNTFSCLRSGDTLVVWKLDRLGRSLKDLVRIIEKLESEGIAFKSLTEGFDTTTSGGRFFFTFSRLLLNLNEILFANAHAKD